MLDFDINVTLDIENTKTKIFNLLEKKSKLENKNEKNK